MPRGLRSRRRTPTTPSRLATAPALLIALGFSTAAHAQMAKDLAGTWTWVAVETTRADGQKVQPFGPTPKGHVVFDGNGGFAYLLTRPGRLKFTGNSREEGTA